MKILYAIQGTGNGHLSRARDIIPVLKSYADVDVLLSGTEADIEIEHEIKYKLYGVSFNFGRNGRVDIIKTIRSSRLHRFIKEVYSLPVRQYDIIINDFEPVSAWAAKLRKVECIGLSHQSAVLHRCAPQPDKLSRFGKLILTHYAPTKSAFGFHFKSYGKGISTPVIREQIRREVPVNKRHYTVYLPAYSHQRIMQILKCCGDVKWQVFTKHGSESLEEHNIRVRPISNDAFVKSISACEGVLCGAGFETPAEALFLRKKLMVIPMSNQLEQVCNATALEQMGVPVVKNLNEAAIPKIQKWVKSSRRIVVDYPNNVETVVVDLLSQLSHNKSSYSDILLPKPGNMRNEFPSIP